MSVKYLVSGGEGALGKTIISMLLQRGEKVRILMSELSDTRIYRNNPNIEICYGISTDKDSMKEFFTLDDPRNVVLFHTDEYVSLSDKTNLTMRRVNVIGAENIVDMCLKRKVGKLVYLSSAYALNPEVKGDEITIHFDRNRVRGEYAKSKAEAASYVMEKIALNRLNAVMVLPTFIIGPGYSDDYEINKVLNSYLNNGTVPPKEGGRAFVDVRDVAKCMLSLADKGEAGAGYIVSGDYKTSGEFFKDVNAVQGIDKPVKTASKLVYNKSLALLVDIYYKITHKENPKEAYTLFSENPDVRFEGINDSLRIESTIGFKDSLSDTIKGVQHGAVQSASAAERSASDNSSATSALELRLKQNQSVAAKSVSESSSEPAPLRPANARAAEEQKNNEDEKAEKKETSEVEETEKKTVSETAEEKDTKNTSEKSDEAEETKTPSETTAESEDKKENEVSAESEKVEDKKETKEAEDKVAPESSVKKDEETKSEDKEEAKEAETPKTEEKTAEKAEEKTEEKTEEETEEKTEEKTEGR